LLRSGTNMLAAVGMNVSLTSNDVTLKVTLEVTGGSDTPVDVTSGPGGDANLVAVHPNPFGARTAVSFSMAQPGAALLELFDVAGRRVRSIWARALDSGEHTLLWDGRDADGRRAPAGVYFFRLQAPDIDRRGKLTRAR
jgi:flagellar hook assembly protein FlgD